SPSAYIRPSFHWAMGWPLSAANDSASKAETLSPLFSEESPNFKASAGGVLASMFLASKASALPITPTAAMASSPQNALQIRIALHFCRRPGVGHRSIPRRADALRELPDGAAPIVGLTRLPA